MTQEQKMRTRDELISFAAAYINRHTLPDCWNDVDDMVDEIMKAGAAEARREDAEGQDPVAYEHVMTYETDETNERLSYSPENAFGKPGKDYSAEYPVVITPLYSRPANVATLEARVKELEGERGRLTRQLQALQPGKVRPVIHSPTRFMDDSRAAIKREGGV